MLTAAPKQTTSTRGAMDEAQMSQKHKNKTEDTCSFCEQLLAWFYEKKNQRETEAATAEMTISCQR